MNDSKKKVLIVEDESAIRRLLARQLTKEGFSVREAMEGGEALLLTKEWFSDIILMDLLMPGMDGFSAIKEIRAVNPYVPIIILTNLHASDSIAKKVMADYPSYYFVKDDVEIDFVIKKVKEILKIS